MASIAGALSAAATLTSTTVDTVTLNAAPFYRVINRTVAAELWITIGAGGATPADPAVAAANAYVVPAVVGAEIVVENPSLGASATTVLKVLGNANAYAVIGYSNPAAAT